EKGKASRPCIADKTRQKPGAARIRYQADARERLDKRRLQAGNDDIAGECNVASGAGGDAVDRGDDRKGEGAYLAYQRIVVCLQSTAEDDGLPRFGKPVAQILAGAKAAARTRDQQGATVLVGFGILNCLSQSLMHGLVECIELVRPIERDDAITGARFGKNRGFARHDLRNRSGEPISFFSPSTSSARRS